MTVRAKLALDAVLAAKEKTMLHGNTDDILEILDIITTATESILTAAKDSGSTDLDKEREESLRALVAKSVALCTDTDLSGFPEVKAACEHVDKLVAMASTLRELQVKLKTSPNNSEEASQHQADLDALRSSIDTIVMPLQATLSTMENMVRAAVALEEQFAALSEQVKSMEAKIKSDRAKLAAIASAVETAANL